MSDLHACAKPHVLLSGKEIAGLAVRVAGTALMPFGARGGAGEAVEFLELCDGSGLTRLEGEMLQFTPDMWHAPQPVAETEDAAVIDAAGASALYFSLALADWMAAMAREHGHALIAVRRPRHSHYLHALPYWLVSRGFTCLTATGDASAGTSCSIASADTGSWWYAKSKTLPAGLASLVERVLRTRDAAGLREAASPVREWLKQHHSDEKLVARTDANRNGIGEESFAFVLASTQPIAPVKHLPSAGDSDESNVWMTSTEWSAKKASCLAEGWPVDRELWESLMRFGDLSLVPTSEESRAGAG